MLCPSHCLVGSRNISDTYLLNCDYPVADRMHVFVTWLGRGSLYVGYLKVEAGDRVPVSSPYKKTSKLSMGESHLNNAP